MTVQEILDIIANELRASCIARGVEHFEFNVEFVQNSKGADYTFYKISIYDSEFNSMLTYKISPCEMALIRDANSYIKFIVDSLIVKMKKDSYAKVLRL